MVQLKRLTPLEALQKAKHFCSYQERCHAEVKEKLYSFGLYKNDVEKLLSDLIEEDYLNEERFAIQFAGGRFRMKHWGKVKIKYELKQKRISDYLIKKALKAIDETDYHKTLKQQAAKKWNTLTGTGMSKVVKTTAYLLQKGYEGGLISEVLKEIKAK